MKKVLLIMAAALALSLTGCNSNSNKDPKTQGEELSQQLNEQVEKQDTAAVLESDQQIRQIEETLIAAGDTAALASFREAMKDSRVRNAAFVTLAKIHNGMSKKEALEQLMQDALKQNVNISAVTSSINAVLAAEAKADKSKAAEKSEGEKK